MALVLVTRPCPAARETGVVLQAAGYDVLLDPLLSFVPLCETPKPDGEAACVVLTSRLTLKALEDRRTECSAAMLALPCYCVGTKTAQDARAFGFSCIHTCQGDAAELAQRVVREQTGAILHIGGQTLSEEPRKSFALAGRVVYSWPVYDMKEAAAFQQTTLDALAERKIEASLFYSLHTLQHFTRLLRATDLEPCCRDQIAIGLSPALAQALKALPFKAVYAAHAPDDESMLDRLQSVCPL